MYYDSKGKTLSVWFDDPKKEVVSEEMGDGTIVNKDRKGKVIGFEKLYIKLQENRKSSPVEFSVI